MRAHTGWGLGTRDVPIRASNASKSLLALCIIRQDRSGVCVCVCVSVSDREREGEGGRERLVGKRD